MAIRAARVALFDFGLNLRPGVAPLDHLSHVQLFSGGVSVIKLKHYGVCLTTVNARMFPEIIEHSFRCIILQFFIESFQPLSHLLRTRQIPTSVRHADTGAAVRRVSILVSTEDGEGVERLTFTAN